ncbi:MAG: DUF4405 domain-containing protein [Bacteroidetes bacterium]|nr:DUF4405 domain-containing protein [Bacteroidota bacterium]
MKKAKVNLVIDAVMLVAMMAILGIGFLVKYILLTGQEKWDKLGENYELTLFSLDRHAWSQIHFILGIVLIGLLILHIILHWKIMIKIYETLIKKKALRIFCTSALLVISIILAIFPFFLNADLGAPVTRYQNREVNMVKEINNEIKLGDIHEPTVDKPQIATQHKHDIHEELPSNIQVTGSMTLIEVSRKYQVPVDHLKNALSIPVSTSNQEKLGQLRRVIGFRMSMVEEIIYNYQKENTNGKNN